MTTIEIELENELQSTILVESVYKELKEAEQRGSKKDAHAAKQLLDQMSHLSMYHVLMNDN